MNSWTDIKKFLCEDGDGAYCTNKEPDIVKICRDEIGLPTELVYNTQIASICAIDIKKICKKDSTACLDGGKMIKDNICHGDVYKKEDFCTDKSHNDYGCATGWKDCLANIDFHFCYSFPELCKDDIFAPTMTEFTDWAGV